MVEFLSSNANLPFTVALGVMLGLALIEIIGSVIGTSVSASVESALPEIDLAPESGSVAGGISHWLSLGTIPLLIWLILFLASFGLIGLGVQTLGIRWFDGEFSALRASLITLPPALLSVSLLGGAIAKLIPQDETQVVSRLSFVGRAATIVSGTARVNSPAQAKLKDDFGQTHYLMAEPSDDEEVFAQGDVIVLVEAHGKGYRAIRHP
jgi:hypothetical protein